MNTISYHPFCYECNKLLHGATKCQEVENQIFVMIGGIDISMHFGMLREMNVPMILLASHDVWSKPLKVFNMFSFFVNFLNEERPFFLSYDHACNFSCVDLPSITRRGCRIFYGHISRLKSFCAIYIWLLILRSFIFFFSLSPTIWSQQLHIHICGSCSSPSASQKDISLVFAAMGLCSH